MFALEFLEGLFGQQSGNRGNHRTQQNTQYDLHKSLHKYKYNFRNTEIHPNIFADVQIKKKID